MSNTTQKFVNGLKLTNIGINSVCSPLLLFGCVTLLILSIIWLIYLSRKLIKDDKSYKLILDSKNMISQHQFETYLKNFTSNRVKNILLMLICVSEFLLVISFILYESGRLEIIENRNETKNEPILSTFSFSHRYYYSRKYITIRLPTLLSSISIYLMFIIVRILTQYLTHQYAYYKSKLRIKSKLTVPIVTILILVILGFIPSLLFLHYILIVPVIVYEFFLIIIATKKLRLLLKQRLSDATNHEYQGNDVICYYSIVSKEYNLCSTVLLTALLLHLIAFSILCIHPLVMTCIVLKSDALNAFIHGTDSKLYISPENVIKFDIIICSVEEILMTAGINLQIIPYFLVSIRRIVRYISKKRISDKNASSQNSLIENLIRGNNEAYMKRNY